MGRTRVAGTAGFTLIETLVALTILSTIAGGVFGVLRSSSRAFQATSAATRLHNQVMETLDRIAERLQASKLSTITPALSSPLSSPRIDFQETTGFAGGATVWGNTERIILQNGQVQWIQNLGLASQRTSVLAKSVPIFLQREVANGVDDNGNGLVDESGLCFTFVGTCVTVRLTIQVRTSAGTTLRHTAEERVFLRNR